MLDEIAGQVQRSRGPGGDNVKYVPELARSLRDMGAEDAHVFALEALLRAHAAGDGARRGVGSSLKSATLRLTVGAPAPYTDGCTN